VISSKRHSGRQVWIENVTRILRKERLEFLYWIYGSDRSSHLSSIGKTWDSITRSTSVAKYVLDGEGNEMKPGSKSL
jgi:hypothetical protein